MNVAALPPSAAVVIAALLGSGLPSGAAGARPLAATQVLQLDSVRVDSLSHGPFGTVWLYHATAHPERVVLFLSGDGGWNLGVVGMGRELAAAGALVIGIDIVRYGQALDREPGACAYPAADLEELSQFVQHRLAFPRYVTPVLVGYSSGATLVYEALAQAPVNTFRGAVSLGFCADITGAKEPCPGDGLAASVMRPGRYVLGPVRDRPLPWIVLQGDVDQVCEAESTAAFVARVTGASLVRLEGVGHGFGVTRRWLPQLRDAVARLADALPPDEPAQAASVRDLPLVEVAATGTRGDVLAVVISGDGGWAGIDREVARLLAADGVPVVGWNSLQYYWRPRTPDSAAADLARVLHAYDLRWHKPRFLLVGYSRGADVLPFLVSRLPEDVRARVALVALIGPAEWVNFQIHATDLVFSEHRSTDLPVLPELERLRGTPVLCLYGSEEQDTICPRVPARLGKAVALPGGHHMHGRYEELGKLILADLQ